MKTLNKELLGFNVPITGVAETLPELVAACGSEERVVALANNYVLYHQHYTKVRDGMIAKLLELTGKKLETNEKGKVTETNEEFIGRAEEETEGGLAQFESAIAEVVAGIAVDYSQPVRGVGEGSVVAKKWLAYYDKLVEESKLDAFISKHELDVSGLDEEATKIVVAKKVKEIVTRAQQDAVAKATAL